MLQPISNFGLTENIDSISQGSVELKQHIQWGSEIRTCPDQRGWMPNGPDLGHQLNL